MPVEFLPALSFAAVPTTSWAIAIAVLLVSGFVVLGIRRSGRRRTPPAAAVSVISLSPVAANTSALEAVGEAMIDAGYTVMTIHDSLTRMSRVNGYPHTEIVALPTALFVSSRSTGELRTGVVSSGHHALLLHQLDDLDTVVKRACEGTLDLNAARSMIRVLRRSTAPFSAGVRVLAYIVLCAALAVLLGGSWVSVGVAALLGAFVGAALLMTATLPASKEPLVTVGLAFSCALVVMLVARLGVDVGLLPALIAPLVLMLPGALLTTGVLELATGHMIAGASRLAAGFMRLVLLAVGIVAAGALVGVPNIALVGPYQPLGPIAPWIAVAVFGVAIVINRGGRVRSIGWTLLVLYVAYAAQIVGDIFFGGVLSAFIGALAMTPVAMLVSRFPSGPAAPVSFLPGFWMLVPGALGLVGVTHILDGDDGGATTLVTTVATMVAISLGVLAGSTISAPERSEGALL